MKHHLAVTALLASIAGCASTPPPDSSSSGAGPAATAPSAGMPARAATPSPAANTARSAGTDVGTAPDKRSVYFDYDSSTVKEEMKPVVRSNASYLGKQQRTARVTVQGNTDERGSREYNLALGQRRADAVKQSLTLLGVPAQQIESVSFGEEKPRVDAENEQAFAENRRADIVYGR